MTWLVWNQKNILSIVHLGLFCDKTPRTSRLCVLSLDNKASMQTERKGGWTYSRVRIPGRAIYPRQIGNSADNVLPRLLMYPYLPICSCRPKSRKPSLNRPKIEADGRIPCTVLEVGIQERPVVTQQRSERRTQNMKCNSSSQ